MRKRSGRAAFILYVGSISRKGIYVLLYKPQDLLSNRPSVRVSIHMLLGADRVNQLEPGVKDLVALIQDISSVRMKPLLKAQPLGCDVRSTMSIPTALAMVVSLSIVFFA